MEGSIPLGDGVDPVTGLIILFLCIIGVAFFSSSEAALISANRIRIRHLAEKGFVGAQAVSRLVDQHDRLFGTILLTENLLIILASSLGTALAMQFLGEEGVLVATLVMTVLIVAFGEITPKTFAVQHSERIALIVARPMEIIMKVAYPLVWSFTRVTNLVIRLIGGGVKKNISPFVTEDEIKMMITIGEEEGSLKEEEKDLLHKVFEFGDTVASESMIPRTSIISIDKGSTIRDVLGLVEECGYSRFPVVDESIDNIVGVIHIKDILVALSKGEIAMESPLNGQVRGGYFIPENKRISELLTEMQKNKVQIAFVMDEYGGTSGLVTVEDLVEEIFGSIHDEFDIAHRDVEIVDEKTFVVSGQAELDEVKEQIGHDLESEDFNTIGGLIFGLFGRLPVAGEIMRYRDLRFEILEMDGRKIARVKITKL
ncbi:MAG: hemolysin family protein [Nitrospirota bacterium]|nr:hemolysin family protein [Nitrospirota bacterium]